MAHVIDYVGPTRQWLALVDPSAKPLTKAPLTPANTQVNKEPAAFTLPATWSGLVQLLATMPDVVLTEAAQKVADGMRVGRVAEAWAGMRQAPTPDGFTPYPWQEQAAVQYARTGALILSDEPGCLQGEAEVIVNRAGKGFRLSIRELVRRFNGGKTSGHGWKADIDTYVQHEAPDGTLRRARVVNAWESGRKFTYTVTTDTGRTLRATDEHPFLTDEGWRRLDELKPGDHVHVRGSQDSGQARQPKPRYVEVAGLYQHPYARGLGRRTSRYRVAKHRLVVEAEMNGMTYAQYVARCRSDFSGLKALDPKLWAVHHVDHDHLNNAWYNLRVMTHADHHALHADVGKTRSVLYKVTTEQVVSVEPYGVEDTYDLEVADEPHNYVANGFVVHNTGKTASAVLAVLEHELRDGLEGRVVVVCPASVVSSWLDAWVKLAPHLKVGRYMGPKRSKWLSYDRVNGTERADVLVTSYETMARDVAKLTDAGVDTLVLDEHHLIKNPNAARTKAAVKLAGAATFGTIALSGTPITHHPGDLWPTLKAVEPGAWPSRTRYQARYLDVVQGDYGDEVVGFLPHRRSEFDLCLMGTQRRVSKADALPWLPPKVYQVREVELPAEWRKLYNSMRDELVAALPDNDEPLNAMSVLAQLQYLQALAASPCDVEVSTTVDEDGMETLHYHAKLKPESWKVAELMAVLEEREGESVVVFSPSRQLVELAGAALEAAGVSHAYVVGGQSTKDRDEAVRAFQAGEVRVILVTTAAGGVGITLTRARCAVFLSRPWSLVEALQAEDRVHRIGSEVHDSVDIVDIVATNTVDQAIRQALVGKAEALGDVLRDPRVLREVLGGQR